jgi:hypothetical protein
MNGSERRSGEIHPSTERKAKNVNIKAKKDKYESKRDWNERTEKGRKSCDFFQA